MKLLPTQPWAQLGAELRRRGWKWENESQLPPLVPGEPEWVDYVHPRARLHASFDPALDLRVIDAEGDPGVLAELLALPRLDSAALAALLAASDVGAVLRGLFGARALAAVELFPAIDTLRRHPDPVVARAAADVAAELGRAAVGAAVDLLAAARAERPLESPLFRGQSLARRRQILRWLGVDRRGVNDAIADALRAAAADEDLEVRVTAAMVAARLGSPGLVPVPPEAAVLLARFPALQEWRAARLPDTAGDDPELLTLHALLEPVPEPPPPPRLPPWLDRDAGQLVLRKSRLPVVLVPSVPHWLGAPGRADHPARRERLPPFVVLRDALPSHGWTDVLAAREGLSGTENIPLRVPDEAQWEAAVRGPDGRPHVAGVWASGPATGAWGARVEAPWEWTDAGVLRHATGDLGERRAAAPDERAGLRLVAPFLL